MIEKNFWILRLKAENLQKFIRTVKVRTVFVTKCFFLTYAEVSNKHGVFLILFEKNFPTTCLIRTSTFINFWEICHQYCFLCNKYFKNPTYFALLEPPRLFDFGKMSYLHVISNCTLIREVRLHIDLHTLESGINIALRLLIFWLFSRGYGLIPDSIEPILVV